MHLRNAVLIALVPALALAAPSKDKKKAPAKKAAPVKDTTPADAGSDTPAVKDDDAPAAKTDPTGSGSGAGSAASTGGGAGSDSEPAQNDKKAATNEPDVDALRQEYLSLRDELFKSRARANAVASQLYSTRIQIKLTYTTARYYNPAKATIRLDGANVYDNASGAIGGDDGVRFDGFIAPGRHVITFRVEATGKDDDTFTSTTETQIVVKAVANKDLVVAARAKDGGDIAYEWKKSEHGSYGLGIDVSVKTQPRAAEGAKK
jgi:hypothetical protein